MANNESLIDLLTHACQCRDASCSRMPSCQKMKSIFAHTKLCKQKTNGDCPICRQLISHFRYHATHCQDAKCAVPICSTMKFKIKQQKLEHRLQQAQLLCRRMADSGAAAPSPHEPAEMQQATTVHIEGKLISILINASFTLVVFILILMLKISIF